MKGADSNFSLLEKSIYAYIRLCQRLSYDPNYYSNKGVYYVNHTSFDNISKIGDITNNVICFEFTAIFSEILKDMGIKTVQSTKLEMEADKDNIIKYTGFDNSHANLQYTVDNILILADSTTSVLKGDLINAKMNNSLNGIKCLNVDKEARTKFENALNKVYNTIQFDNDVFKKYDKEVKEKPLKEKLKILFDDIINSNYNSVDLLSYIINIKHSLFTEDELDWNLKISYLGRINNKQHYPVVLFSVNTNDIKNVVVDTSYYMYDTNERVLMNLEKEEIEEMFNEGKLFYIDDKFEIPNINTSNIKR
jgi:hypothetical protein